ncbi:MAG: hypothetical protein H6R32_357 [Candidatus Aminicenantes bacterium]|nr:hypothetical protein [Candidatus Aminicenantes bacterium]
MFLVGIAGRKSDPAPADDDQGRFEVGDVVVEDGRVLEDEADVRVADLDPAGPPGPGVGDADLEEPGRVPGDLPADDGPGPAPPLEGESPAFDEGGVVVLEEGLHERAGRRGAVDPDPGRAQLHPGHVELVEICGQAGFFVRPERGGKGREVRGPVPGLERRAGALDEGRGGFGVRRFALLGRGHTGESDDQKQDPYDRFSHGFPYYSIRSGLSMNVKADFMPRTGGFFPERKGRPPVRAGRRAAEGRKLALRAGAIS